MPTLRARCDAILPLTLPFPFSLALPPSTPTPYSHLATCSVPEACRGSKRCPFGKGWPAQVREIIAAGWRADPAVRPEFRQLVPALEKALAGGEPDVKHL
mmetsp:Transcript_20572/g.60687  ORF Transcript_20572/g.60687 Transcript_20572/m.60687 type:complete len:100 (+) Transcript_20572:123-422(+)